MDPSILDLASLPADFGHQWNVQEQVDQEYANENIVLADVGCECSILSIDVVQVNCLHDVEQDESEDFSNDEREDVAHAAEVLHQAKDREQVVNSIDVEKAQGDEEWAPNVHVDIGWSQCAQVCNLYQESKVVQIVDHHHDVCTWTPVARTHAGSAAIQHTVGAKEAKNRFERVIKDLLIQIKVESTQLCEEVSHYCHGYNEDGIDDHQFREN